VGGTGVSEERTAGEVNEILDGVVCELSLEQLTIRAVKIMMGAINRQHICAYPFYKGSLYIF